MWGRVSILFFGVMAMTACSSGGDPALSPKKQLERYITVSFSVTNPSDRGELAKFLTGPAKERLETWSDEEFKAAFIESKRKFHNLVIRQITSISATETNVVYDLTYFDRGREFEARVTNSKLAHMELVDQKWLIRDVRNIKELVEYKDALTLP